MLRLKLSQLKQIIAVAIIPRIFIRDTTPIKNRLNTHTPDVFNFARKSTDSGSKDDELEKQRQIIEKCFGETPQASESKHLKDDSSEMEREHKTIEPSEFVRLSDAEKCAENADNEPSRETNGIEDEASVRATTANIAEKTLNQKLETIVETPHVEASPQKIEGFNSTPKVLGYDSDIQKIDLDDLAKRCVGAPIGNIDDMLIKEMKNMVSNDTKTQPDMNFIKSQGVEKYYSGIFEHISEQAKKIQKLEDTPKEPLHLLCDSESFGDNEIKSERFTPLHVDAAHLFAFDEGIKDYKETGFFQDSSVYLSSEIEESLLDLPNIITPYDSPIMPFYEYLSKEQVILNDFNDNETITISETATDTSSVADMPRAEEIFLSKENKDKPSFVVEKHEMNSVELEPTLSHIVRPGLGNNMKERNIPRGFRNFSRERLRKLLYLYTNRTDNKTGESHVLSKSTETPPATTITPSPNSSKSGTIAPEAASKEGSKHNEIPPNSAISANQNPGEYYMISLNEQQASNLSEQLQTLTADNIIHAFCAQLQEMEDGGSEETEDSIMSLEYPVLLRDPFSYILYEPQMERNAVTEVPNDIVTATTVKNVTQSTKNEATNADDCLPLSQMLKRIRDKNRLEVCQNLLLESAKMETSKKFTCMTSMDSNKQKSGPRPCQPPPKPPKEKCPKPRPPPCPPKKDPCAKLVPFFLNSIIRFDVSFDVQAPMKQYNGNYYYKSMLADDIIERLRKLGKNLWYLKGEWGTSYIKDTTGTRDLEPWIPIPSWPAPKIEKRRPFVCPKEGCKPVPVPRSNPPKQKPCLGVPRKLFSFSQAILTAVMSLILYLFNYR